MDKQLFGFHQASCELLPKEHAGLGHKLLTDPNVSPASREQYRQLAATLHNAQTASGVKAIMIASAVAGEGKTLTAANLALTFTESYQRSVLLVDADLRRPSLHKLFEIRELARAGDRVSVPQRHAPRVWQVTPRLGILTTALPCAAPMAELTSERMRQAIREARHTFDWIIIDTPPVALLSDASLLASVVDGTVIVVKARSTPLDLVKRALDTVGRQKTLGVVLNAASRRPQDSPYGYDEYYSAVEAS
jgi:protein-tyrosine kinase